MAVVVSGKSSRTVIVDRSRAASIVQHQPEPVRVPDRRTATAVEKRAVAVGVSSPGPQGKPGQDGGSAELRIAAVDLGGHRVVRSVDASSVAYADCNDATHGDDTLGMTTGAALQGGSVAVQRIGPLTFDGWAWVPGLPVFLGANGQITQTPPAGAFEQVIGYAEDATTVHLRIAPPIYSED